MSKHFASAQWEGALQDGKGKYALKSSGYEGAVNFASRFGDDKSASSPEELIGAAHASCFSMAFSHALDQEDYKPEKIHTSAEVTLTKTADGFAISDILLKTKGSVQGIGDEKFQDSANKAKDGCPVSKALAVPSIRLEAELE